MTTRRPFHVGCEFTGLGICYCLEGTPVHLRSDEAAEAYCRRAEDIAELWSTVTDANDTPEETQILLPVLFKRKTRPKHKISIEGLKVAQDEAENARANAERHVVKTARKANALGIPHTLLADLGLEESQVGIPAAEESVEDKLEAIQAAHEQTRAEIRELDRLKEELGIEAETEANEIGDNMDALLQQLTDIKGKLPPDRVADVTAVQEAATSILAKSRKTKRRQRRLLKPEDLSDELTGSWLSVFWPDDNQWWNGFVQSVNLSQSTAMLLYETEEAEELNLKQLIEKGEVAWLDIPTTSDPTTTTSKRRKKHHIPISNI